MTVFLANGFTTSSRASSQTALRHVACWHANCGVPDEYQGCYFGCVEVQAHAGGPSPLRLQLSSGWTFDLGDTAVIHLGRTGTDEAVDVDLTRLGAVPCGVSRTHARIRREQDGYSVVDLGSRNDTLLNGARLHPGHSSLLQHGDQLRLGALELLVLLQESNERAIHE